MSAAWTTSVPPWDPSRWRSLPAAHQPTWPDSQDLERVEKELSSFPPLVFAGEARDLTGEARTGGEWPGVPAPGRRLRRVLRRLQRRRDPRQAPDHPADRRRAHLLGGCPDSERSAESPASSPSHDRVPTETVDGTELPSFLGHMVNDLPFSEGDRIPQADRLLRAYHQSASTLNLLRAFTKGWLRRPAPGAVLEPGVRRNVPGGSALRAARRRDRSGAPIHGRGRHLLEAPRDPRGRLLHQSRSADPAVRGSAHPPGQPHRRVVRLLGPHALDRRADPPGRRLRTSSSSAASRTRSAARSVRPPPPTRSSSSARRSIPTESRGGSP